MAIESLRPAMATSRISRAMDVSRSSIYYRRKERSGKRKPRISESIESEVIRLWSERTTYGYRRIWALLRNSGIHVIVSILLVPEKLNWEPGPVEKLETFSVDTGIPDLPERVSGLNFTGTWKLTVPLLS